MKGNISQEVIRFFAFSLSIYPQSANLVKDRRRRVANADRPPGKELRCHALEAHSIALLPSDNLRYSQNFKANWSLPNPSLWLKSLQVRQVHSAKPCPPETSTWTAHSPNELGISSIVYAQKASFFWLSTWFMTTSSHHKTVHLLPLSLPPFHSICNDPFYLFASIQ